MSEGAEDKPKKAGGAKMLVAGAALAAALGGGAFYVVYAGVVALPLPPANAPDPTMIAASAAPGAAQPAPMQRTPAEAPAFAPMEPILVSLGQGSAIRQLQLTAQLEVDPMSVEAVAGLQPRVRDVLTTYLRAVNPADVEDPAALLRMRAQMLRRVQVVTGDGLVRDLLVTEFVLR